MLSKTWAETIALCFRPICERARALEGESERTHEMLRLREIGKFVRALIWNSTAVWGIIAVRWIQFSRHIRDLIFLSNKWNKAAIITSSDVYHSQLKLTVYNLHIESIKAVIRTLTTLLQQSIHDWLVMLMKSIMPFIMTLMNLHKDTDSDPDVDLLIMKHGIDRFGIILGLCHFSVTLNCTNLKVLLLFVHKRQQPIRIRV